MICRRQASPSIHPHTPTHSHTQMLLLNPGLRTRGWAGVRRTVNRALRPRRGLFHSSLPGSFRRFDFSRECPAVVQDRQPRRFASRDVRRPMPTLCAQDGWQRRFSSAAASRTAEIAAGVLAGDRRSLSKAITLVESHHPLHREQAQELLHQLTQEIERFASQIHGLKGTSIAPRRGMLGMD